MKSKAFAAAILTAAVATGAAHAGNGADGSTSVLRASLAPASGRASGTLTFTMKVAVADDIRPCPPGTPAEATGCFSRKGAADVRGLGRVEESWDPVVDETGAGCGPNSLRFFPSTARFAV